jgi:hypothetical protein
VRHVDGRLSLLELRAARPSSQRRLGAGAAALARARSWGIAPWRLVDFVPTDGRSGLAEHLHFL